MAALVGPIPSDVEPGVGVLLPQRPQGPDEPYDNPRGPTLLVHQGVEPRSVQTPERQVVPIDQQILKHAATFLPTRLRMGDGLNILAQLGYPLHHVLKPQ